MWKTKYAEYVDKSNDFAVEDEQTQIYNPMQHTIQNFLI
jgi:hypothetical protein